jgi:PAS domain S-box-containing protein
MPAPPVDLESLARTLNALFLGFQVIGFDWKYIYVNPAAAGHGRTTPEALIGRSIFESYPDIASQEPLMSHLRRAMEERTNHVFENQFTFPDGTMRWFHIRVEPVPEGICIYSVDIDERKTAEVALRDKLARLEGTRPTLLRRVWQSLANWGARRHGRGSAFKGRL